MNAKTADELAITETQVREFLKSHPEFLRNNPDIVNDMAPPQRELGAGVIDFQQFMVKNLQTTSRDLQGKYDLLVEFCRDNMSAQSQVHAAVLKLIGTRDLEQLLSAVTLDLMSLFDVDVVRLAMESELSAQQQTHFSEHSASGIVFIPPGTIDDALGAHKNVLLVKDCSAYPPAGFEDIFADCTGLVNSCAFLRLSLENVSDPIILAFGVRYKDRFHPGQGIELLSFLAQIVAHQLERYLGELSV